MNKSLLKKVAAASFVNGVLSEKEVNRIANVLAPSDLKEYVRLLKTELAKQSVTIVSAAPLSPEQQEELKGMYTDKLVSFETDTTLLGGVRVIENDMIYEKNLAHTLSSLESHVTTL